MAFPLDVDPFLQAVDPSTAQDIANIKAYQSRVESGDFSGAKNFLMSLSNGVQMSLNAGRYNQVIDAIIAIEQFYLGLGGVREFIQNNVSAYTNYKQWDNTYTYSVGNIAGNNSNWYSCIQENKGIQPGVSSDWETYWQLILEQQPAVQYPIQRTQPTGQIIGDLWLKDMTPITIDPVLGNNTPEAIKYAFDNNVVPSTWNVGDTIKIQLNDGTEEVFVLYDKQRGRYEKTDGSGSTNAVLGSQNIIMSAPMNTTSTNVGGWAQSNMKTVTMNDIYNKFADDWKSIVSKVKVASTVGGQSTAISYSDNMCFVPAYAEFVPNVTTDGYKDEGTVFDYFASTGTGADTRRAKTFNGRTYAYWYRSPSLRQSAGSVGFSFVLPDGAFEPTEPASNPLGVAVVITI